MKKRSSTMSRSRRTTTTRRSIGKRITSRSRRAMPTARRSSGRTSNRGRGSAKSTTDHEQIRRWVEARGGHPATVSRTARGAQAAGVIRIDFPGFSGAGTLKPISWDEWFRVFDERRLEFLYQDKTAGGKPSRFNKLVSRE
jgi:hypothetical protein